ADPAAMAESIVMLLRSPDSSGRLGQHARERALELFATDRFAAAYRASYEKLTLRVFADERPAIVETMNVSEAPPMLPTAASPATSEITTPPTTAATALTSSTRS